MHIQKLKEAAVKSETKEKDFVSKTNRAVLN